MLIGWNFYEKLKKNVSNRSLVSATQFECGFTNDIAWLITSFFTDKNDRSNCKRRLEI